MIVGHGMTEVVLEFDSEAAINMLNKGSWPNSPYRNMVVESWSSIAQTLRAGNRARLAKLGADQEQEDAPWFLFRWSHEFLFLFFLFNSVAPRYYLLVLGHTIFSNLWDDVIHSFATCNLTCTCKMFINLPCHVKRIKCTWPELRSCIYDGPKKLRK